jgi:hypothetical protein
MYALRALCAAEFGAALGAWSLGMCPWPVCGAVATIALVMFLLTWPDPSSPERAVAAPESHR